jgi:hypothetical protein
MKRMYQTEWQGIKFADFAKLSKTDLPGAEFYDAFYSELFRRYAGFEELDVNWRRNKGELADWIAMRAPAGSRVLSVGCGIGYMENRIHQKHGRDIELHVQDFASNALNWLRQTLPDERIHLAGGGVTGLFDLIYLSAVDYALQKDEMVKLLSDQQNYLCKDGTLIMLSASFLEESSSVIQQTKLWGKDIVKQLLEVCGLYHRGQFWGWQRNQSEYRELMASAGYVEVADGFIETQHQRTYYIEGHKLSK